MAGMQLPTLQRMAPSAPTSVGRDNEAVVDYSKANAINNRAISSTLEAGVQLGFKLEDDAAEAEATKADIEISTRMKKDLQDVESWQGDPTVKFKEIRDNWAKYENELSEKYSGVSDYTKKFINARVMRAKQSYGMNADIQESIMKSKFDDRNDDAATELKKDLTVSLAARYQNPQEDEQGFDVILDHFNQTKGQQIQKLARQGLIYNDANGKTVFSPAANRQIQKVSSDMAKDMIGMYQRAGNLKAAQFMMEKFSSELTADDRVTLTKSQNDTALDLQAATLVMQVDGMESDKALAQIDRLTKDDPLLNEKAYTKFEARRKIRANVRTELNKEGFEQLAHIVRDGVANGTFPTVKSMLDHKDIKGHPEFDGLKNTQIKALAQIIEEPKTTTNVTNLDNAWQMVAQNRISKSTTYSEMQALLVGVSKEDRSPIMKHWQRVIDDTEPEARARTTALTANLRSQLQEAGIIKEQYGRLNNTNEQTLTRYTNELIQAADTYPPGATSKEQLDYVRAFVMKKVKGEAFTGMGDRPGLVFPSASPTPAPSGTPAPAGTAAPAGTQQVKSRPKMTPEQTKKAMTDYWFEVTKKRWSPTENPKTDTVAALRELYLKKK